MKEMDGGGSTHRRLIICLSKKVPTVGDRAISGEVDLALEMTPLPKNGKSTLPGNRTEHMAITRKHTARVSDDVDAPSNASQKNVYFKNVSSKNSNDKRKSYAAVVGGNAVHTESKPPFSKNNYDQDKSYAVVVGGNTVHMESEPPVK